MAPQSSNITPILFNEKSSRHTNTCKMCSKKCVSGSPNNNNRSLVPTVINANVNTMNQPLSTNKKGNFTSIYFTW